MRSKPLFLLSCCIACLTLHAQLKQGEVALGGAGIDCCYGIVQTDDKGYVMTGITNSYNVGGCNAVYVVKTDSAGKLLWTKVMGGKSGVNGGDGSQAIVETHDKGLAIAGLCNSYGAGNGDFYVIKLDSAGNLKWSQTIGGPGMEWATAITETYDKGLAITGTTQSFGAGGYDIYVVKLDSAGNLKWAESVGDTGDDEGNAIIRTADKGLAVAGYTTSYGAGGKDMYIIKLDSAGNLKWDKTIGGVKDDAANSLVQTTDKGLVVTGYTFSYNDTLGGDIYLVKLDSTGNLKWAKTIGGKGYDVGNSIIQTKNGGLAIAGYTNSFLSYYSFYIIKTDKNGNVQWTRTMGTPYINLGYSVIQTADMGYAVSGYSDTAGASEYDFCLMKLDSLGDICTTNVADSGRENTAGAIIKSGGIITTGGVAGSGVLVGSGGLVATICNSLTSINDVHYSKGTVDVHPNPGSGIFTISEEKPGGKAGVEIYNILGQQVYSQSFNTQCPEFKVDLSNKPSGIYLYRIISETGELIGEGKLIIQ